MSDTQSRSIVKTITWRITGSTSSVLIAYTVTGSIGISFTIGLVHLIINTALYWVHERLWTHTTWGQN
jgi:uncharacterized membrane protein